MAGVLTTGQLLAGYIDLIGVANGQITVLDFKTDALPPGRVEDAYPQYVAQVSAYARLVEGARVPAPGQVRCGLLCAAEGQIRWL